MRAARIVPGTLASTSAVAPPWSTLSAGPDRHDQIGLDECGVDARRVPAGDDGPQVVRLAVVHDDRATEVPSLVGPQQRLELPPPGPSLEPAGDEDGHALAGDPRAGQLAEHRGEGVPPRIVLGGRERHRRRLDDDRRAAATRRERLQRPAGKRVAERLGDGGADVGERVERRRSAEQHRVLRERDERHARAGMQGHAHRRILGGRPRAPRPGRRQAIARWRR